MIVALIALFCSLGGVSYGFATGEIDSREIRNNDVRSLDIRNNEIRTRDLRNNEVRGIDIRNSTIQGRDVQLNTITGDDVREDTLQKVPSATQADTATKANSADSVGSLKIINPTTVAEGASPVVLATQGPLTVYGECLTPGPMARVSVSTSEDNSAAAGTSRIGTTDAGFQEPDLDVIDGRTRIVENSGGMAVRVYAVGVVSGFAPSGKAFSGDIGVLRDSSGAGSCRFHGSLALQG
jgi:hypothetical protein